MVALLNGYIVDANALRTFHLSPFIFHFSLTLIPGFISPFQGWRITYCLSFNRALPDARIRSPFQGFSLFTFCFPSFHVSTFSLFTFYFSPFTFTVSPFTFDLSTTGIIFFIIIPHKRIDGFFKRFGRKGIR